jgi:hypothetical protein
MPELLKQEADEKTEGKPGISEHEPCQEMPGNFLPQ